MIFPCYRLLLGGLLLLLVTACADPSVTAAAPSTESAPLAVDLGASSRISRIAGAPGEGEGYDAMRSAPASPDAMAGMAHANAAPLVKASAPAADHANMDHSSMGHGAMPGPAAAAPAAPQVAQAAQAQGTATVNSIDPAGHKINLSHGPIPAIGWPAMTMDFAVAHTVDLRALKPGTKIGFTMQRGADGMYVIQSISPAGGQ